VVLKEPLDSRGQILWHLSQRRWLKANCRNFVIGARQPAGPEKYLKFPGSSGAPSQVPGNASRVPDLSRQTRFRIGEMSPVIKQDEYRQFVLHCLELANTAASLADRAHLLTMVEAWLDLAERATRQPPRQVIAPGDHPLVRRTLGAISST
jgi:hypothetical protein